MEAQFILLISKEALNSREVCDNVSSYFKRHKYNWIRLDDMLQSLHISDYKLLEVSQFTELHNDNVIYISNFNLATITIKN